MATAAQNLPLRRLSVTQYHALGECGALRQDERVELLEGLIVQMSPRSPAHEAALLWLDYWLKDRLDPALFKVRVGAPLTLADSEPEPDISVCSSHQIGLRSHPTGAALVIEVAYSSRDYDLSVKPRIYARAVQEYWVCDLAAQRFVVFSKRSAQGYDERREVGRGELLHAGCLPLPALPIAELFAAAHAETAHAARR